MNSGLMGRGTCANSRVSYPMCVCLLQATNVARVREYFIGRRAAERLLLPAPSTAAAAAPLLDPLLRWGQRAHLARDAPLPAAQWVAIGRGDVHRHVVALPAGVALRVWCAVVAKDVGFAVEAPGAASVELATAGTCVCLWCVVHVRLSLCRCHA